MRGKEIASDQANIIGGTLYETVVLRGHNCVVCDEGFAHHISARRLKFRPHDFTFYCLRTVTFVGEERPGPVHYLHPDCLLRLALDRNHYQDAVLRVDQRRVWDVALHDRLDKRLYKTNYLEKLPVLLKRHYEEACRDDILAGTRRLFTLEQDFPRYYYRFEGDQKAFDRVVADCNKWYAQHGVSLVLTPPDVTAMYSKGSPLCSRK